MPLTKKALKKLIRKQKKIYRYLNKAFSLDWASMHVATHVLVDEALDTWKQYKQQYFARKFMDKE